MRGYEEFLSRQPDPELAPEALRRLADLQLAEEQDAVSLNETPTGGTSRAAALYRELLERFPDNPRNDSALYQLARAYEQAGEPEPAMRAMSRYAEKYSGGEKIDEVQFRRGELLFVQRDYRAVLGQGAQSSYHQQALYKLGWAQFKQGDATASLDAFLQLLDEEIGDYTGIEPPDDLERARGERLEDTLRAVSLNFVNLGETAAVAGYFDSHGGKTYEPLVYAALAALHLGKERYADAADVNRLFATAHPHHDAAPLFQSRVIDVYLKAGFAQRVLEEKQAFVERYQPAADYWRQHDPQRNPTVPDDVRRHLRDIAQHYHARAQAEKTAVAYADAERWYQLTLQAFGAGEQTPMLHFLYAELLNDAGHYDRAVAAYEQVAYRYPAHDKSAAAGYAALLAYDKQEARLPAVARTTWHRAGIDSALRFAERFPDHAEALPARTRAAQQLFALQDYAAAIAAARGVVKSPESPATLQRAAWIAIAHAQFELADFQQAEAAYTQVLARTAADDKQRAGLAEKLAASVYQQGRQAREAGDLHGSAAQFARIAVIAPGSEVNAAAQYDAAATYINLKQWPAAIRILEQWRRDYPGHALQGETTQKLAVLYQETGQPLLAAAEFTRIAAGDAAPDLKREAAWTAATLYRQGGQSGNAIEAYRRYIGAFPQPVDAATEAAAQLASLYGDSGDSRNQRQWQQRIIDMDAKAGAQRTDRTRFLAAQTRLALAAVEAAASRQVRLVEPLKKTLASRKKFMQAAIDMYEAAASYEISAVTTEAAFRIAELYADFGQALMASERPRNLSGEALAQYELLLEEQAFPFEEQAIATHETNAQRLAVGVDDEWVRRSMARLAELVPGRYARVDGVAFGVSDR
jgi:tetratricopeptide (TPR) repeat protein